MGTTVAKFPINAHWRFLIRRHRLRDAARKRFHEFGFQNAGQFDDAWHALESNFRLHPPGDESQVIYANTLAGRMLDDEALARHDYRAIAFAKLGSQIVQLVWDK